MGRTTGRRHADMGGCQTYEGGSETGMESSGIAADQLTSQRTPERSPQHKPYLLHSYTSKLLLPMDMRTLCALPGGLHEAEWIASHTVVFFKNITVISSALSDFCTASTCPTASGPGGMTYYWTAGDGKKVRCSAPLYTDCAMSYIQRLLDDENVFPTRAGASFPKGFVFLVQRIFLYMFHTLAHLYGAHFSEVVQLQLHPHLNTLFVHVITFGQQFGLLESADTQPLDDLFSALVRSQST